jgi:hypothetical protein
MDLCFSHSVGERKIMKSLGGDSENSEEIDYADEIKIWFIAPALWRARLR